MDDNLNISKFLLSPFKDDYEAKYIKNYAKKLIELDDFKDLSLYLVQYNDSDIYNKKIKLMNYPQIAKRKIISIRGLILPYNGLYNFFSKEIMIFIDNQIKFGKLKFISIDMSKLKLKLIKDENSLKKTCCSILKTMYHEKKHYLQDVTKDNSFDSIMYQIEKNVRLSSYGFVKYLAKHDKWYFEIDANNYGVKKTLEYYKNHPHDTNVDLNYLKSLEKRYKYDKLMYNFDDFFTAYNILREKIPFFSEARNKLSNIFLKDRNELWHRVLYNDKKRLNNVEEIVNHPLFNEIDPKFMNRVLTSKYLNKNTNYDDLGILTLYKLQDIFKKRLNETIEIVNTILSEKENATTHKLKKELQRLTEDIKYYEVMIAQINTKILDKNKKIYSTSSVSRK